MYKRLPSITTLMPNILQFQFIPHLPPVRTGLDQINVSFPLPQVQIAPANAPLPSAPPTSNEKMQQVSQTKKEIPIKWKKNKFTPEEDRKLESLIQKYGAGDWLNISQMMGTRNPRQCRERWNNYLNPQLRVDPWTIEEDQLLVMKYQELGPHWAKIARCFMHRSDNSVRNRWQLLLRQSAKRNSSSDN